MNNRRSTRLAIKKRIDYNEDDQPIIDMNLNQVGIPSNEETVQIVKDVQVQTFMKNNYNSFVDDGNENQNNNDLNNEPQYSFSNSKEKEHDFTKVNDENPPGRFGRKTKVNRIKFQQASKTLSELKLAIKSTKSTIYSFESCLKGKSKSLYDNNASINNNNNNDNEMDIDEIDEINDEYKNDNSHNIENSSNITKKEGIEDSELVGSIIDDQENKPQSQEQVNQSEQMQDNQLQEQDLIDVNYQEPLMAQNPIQDNNSKHNLNGNEESKQPILPRFTLKLSDDLKEAFKLSLPITTSLEDTDIIVYDPSDPDFDNDDSIVTLVERKQNMTTRRKISLNKRITNEDLLSSNSQYERSINVQTNAYNQITKDYASTTNQTIEGQSTTAPHIFCIDDDDEGSKNQANEKQDVPADNHEQQEQQDNILISFNFTSTNESKVQEGITEDEPEVCKNDRDIKDSTSNEVSDIRTSSQSTNKDDGTSNKLEVQEDNTVTTEDESDTVEEVVMESKFQKVSISSILNPSIDFEPIKNQNSQSDLTPAENLKNNLNDNISPPNEMVSNKKIKNQKSTVKKNLKNVKTNEAVKSRKTELISSPSISNCEVVPAKRSEPDDSKTSGDILGPFLELLDENRKKRMINREINIDETSQMQRQLATNATDGPSNSRAETMNLPYSSMSAEEHRKYLQIESMICHNPGLISKEQRDFYQNMTERIMNERNNFMQWQFERSKLFIGHLNQLIENKVMNHLRYGRHSNINDYSVIESTFGLNPAGPGEPELKFKQKLGSIGKHFEIPPSVVNKIPIPLGKELWLDDAPSVDTISADFAMKDYWQKMRSPVVSQDPLIPEMLSNHKIDIVISSGGLAALVGLAESTDVELEIPIKIVEMTKENSASKIIFIDKPFVKKQMTPREINQVYYNTAFKSMVLKNKDAELQYSSNNLEYSLWNIDDINILIRCKSDGYYKESDQKIRTVGMKTKLDYQLDYNYEIITSVEQSRWWIYSTIRNNADLMLGRINVPMNTLDVVEKVSAGNILHDQTRVKSLIKKLHFIFKHLQCSLLQGSHILRHEKGEPYASIYKSTETAGHYSLQIPDSQEISSRQIKVDRETIPFVPLVWKGTQTQIMGTFPIRDEQIRTSPPQRKSKKKFQQSEKSKSKKKKMED